VLCAQRMYSRYWKVPDVGADAQSSLAWYRLYHRQVAISQSAPHPTGAIGNVLMDNAEHGTRLPRCLSDALHCYKHLCIGALLTTCVVIQFEECTYHH
jgi:hypothetical protein